MILIAIVSQITSCKKDGKPKVVAKTPDKISYKGTATLSVARIYMAAAGAGNKILIGGGATTDGSESNVVDIYDASANTWTTTKFSKLQGYSLNAVTTGSKIIFSDLATAMEIYDVNSGVWKTVSLQLSVQRTNISLAAAAGKVFFAGGYTGQINGFNQFTDAVDIYDIATDAWSAGPPLNYGRVCSTIGYTANKVLFGGLDISWYGPGYHGNNPDINNDIYTIDASGTIKNNIVKVFLNSQGTPAGTNGNYILFDQLLYNATDDSFTAIEYVNGLFAYRNRITGTGTKFIVALDFAPNIDVYDIVSKTWTTMPTGATRVRTASAAAGNKIILAGGVVSGTDWIASDKVDIFTLSAGK